MTTYFSSDLHFCHDRIIGYSVRPFKTVQEMNEKLVEHWNATVKPTDTVWCLGDVAMGAIEESLRLCSRLHGQKHLLCGNHDRPWAGWQTHRPGKKHDWTKRYMEEGGFASVLDGLTVPGIQLRSVTGIAYARMCHFPYEGDHTEQDRYLQWRPKDEGSWLLCGHVHEAWRIRGRQLNVGVDQWAYRPVSEATLADIILGYEARTNVTTH